MKTEKKAQHTPGPWRTSNSNYVQSISGYRSRIHAERIGIAPASAYGANQQESEANARLIAAAPDLLEAAKRALAEMTVNGHGCVSEHCVKVCAICDASHDLRAAIAKAEAC